MKLSHELAKMFEEDMQAVIQKEIDDPAYLPQEDFIDCQERARAMIAEATKDVEKVLTLAIAHHREGEHKENRSGEIFVASEGLSPERLDVGARIWWAG